MPGSTSTPLSIERANLASLWLETLLYGVFLVFCCASLYILLYKKMHGKNHIVMVCASLLMFILITSHLICDLIRAFLAFTTTRVAAQYFGDVTQPLELAKTIFYVLSTVVGDAIMLYRCWVIWNGMVYAMALPVLLYIAVLITGAGGIWSLTTLQPGQLIFIDKFAVWALSFFATSLTSNAFCTMLISARILYTYRTATAHAVGDSKIWKAAVILIESAAIYSVSLFAMIGCYVSKSNAQYITLDMIPPIIGISFQLIIVRVGLGLSRSGLTTNTANSAHRPAGGRPSWLQSRTAHPGGPGVHVHVASQRVVDVVDVELDTMSGNIYSQGQTELGGNLKQGGYRNSIEDNDFLESHKP